MEKHTYLIRNYIIDKNVLSRVLVLMTSAHAHLALGIEHTPDTVGKESVWWVSYGILSWGNGEVTTQFIMKSGRGEI